MPTGRLENGTDIPGKVFAEALSGAVATMAGISLDISDETMEQGIRFDCDGITGVMMLTGNKNAVLFITTNKVSAIELVSYMTGIESNELTDDDLYDGVVEIVNMVAGMARAKLADSPFAFNISSPFALTGEQARIITKRSIAGYLAKITASNVHFMMRLFYV